MVENFAGGCVEGLANMVFASIDFMFDDALDVDFEAFLIHAQQSNLIIDGVHTQVINVFGRYSESIRRFG
jgi:hypothetical protein